MSDDSNADDTVQLWLVERSYDTRNLITLIYATPDGERYLQKERSAHLLSGDGVTVAVDVTPDELAPVGDEETRERYEQEAQRMRERHAPDETV